MAPENNNINEQRLKLMVQLRNNYILRKITSSHILLPVLDILGFFGDMINFSLVVTHFSSLFFFTWETV